MFGFLRKKKDDAESVPPEKEKISAEELEKRLAGMKNACLETRKGKIKEVMRNIEKASDGLRSCILSLNRCEAGEEFRPVMHLIDRTVENFNSRGTAVIERIGASGIMYPDILEFHERLASSSSELVKMTAMGYYPLSCLSEELALDIKAGARKLSNSAKDLGEILAEAGKEAESADAFAEMLAAYRESEKRLSKIRASVSDASQKASRNRFLEGQKKAELERLTESPGFRELSEKSKDIERLRSEKEKLSFELRQVLGRSAKYLKAYGRAAGRGEVMAIEKFSEDSDPEEMRRVGASALKSARERGLGLKEKQSAKSVEALKEFSESAPMLASGIRDMAERISEKEDSVDKGLSQKAKAIEDDIEKLNDAYESAALEKRSLMKSAERAEAELTEAGERLKRKVSEELGLELEI